MGAWLAIAQLLLNTRAISSRKVPLFRAWRTLKLVPNRQQYNAIPNAIYVFSSFTFLCVYLLRRDRLWGLVIRVRGYRSIGPGFDSQRYQIYWDVVGLERVPLSLVSTAEELVGRKSLENREYGRTDPSRWPRGTLYPQKLALTSLTSGGRSVGIVHSRTHATEFSYSS
jgi:hypothetical protein